MAMLSKLQRAVSVILCITILIGAAPLAMSAAGAGIDGVVINEVCTSNKKSLKAKDGSAPDWIELYNTGKKAVSLKGASLSDDSLNLKKFVFPDITLGAGEYLIVFASGKESKSGELHTAFKLSGGNESLILTGADGKIADEVLLPVADEDEVYARYPNGSGSFRLQNATPGAINDTAKQTRIANPVFSKQSGFYSDRFDLEMSASSGCTIYYTTDGSIPTTSSKKYSSAISITDKSAEKAVLMYKQGVTSNRSSEFIPSRNFGRANVIRAIAVDPNGKKSKVTTASYFVGGSLSNTYKNVVVVSVVSDPDGLYNSKTGIFVAGDVFTKWRRENPNKDLNGDAQANYNQRGKEWEREAHIDFFDSLELGFSVDCGMRVQGGWSRDRSQKSMKFYMRSEYGASKIEYKLFKDNVNYYDGAKIKTYKRFMLRNGGNDDATLKFKCPWTQELLSDLNFSTQDSRLAVAFLDGEYWGVYTLNDVYNDDYISTNYGVPTSEVVMMKVGELEEGEKGDEKLFWDCMSFVEKNDMSRQENYDKACKMFDMDSLADYIAAEIYIANQDWLWNNWACWRTRSVSQEGSEYADGRWRFMMYDTEFSMDLYNGGSNYKDDRLYELLNKKDGHLGKMFASLMKNQDFKAKFIVSVEKVANVCFEPVYAGKLLDSYFNEYSPYLHDHFQRFVGWQNVDGIKKNTEKFKKWLTNRYGYINTMLKKDLKLGSISEGTLNLMVNDSKGGKVTFDGAQVHFSNGKWSAKLLSGYKVDIVAIPEEGYEFTGWSGAYNGSEPALRINPNKTMTLKANFAKKE